MKKRNQPLSLEDQLAQLRASLRTYRSRCTSLERKIARLLAGNPLAEMEREISRLEQRCRDLEDRWEECETLLRKQERNVA